MDGLITLEQAIARYGQIVNGVWANEAKFCTLLEVPPALQPTLINSATGKPTTHIYCNKDIEVYLLCALSNVVSRGLASELKTFDGCFEPRDIRGEPGKLSTHSYALAVDFNAKENPLGGPSRMPKELVQCFLDAQFVWG